jgi:hypothetical protein
MLTIPYLEMPITHVCNLHCDGCCYYANYNIKTMVSANEARESISAWSKRIQPRMLKILGGEPTVNRQLPEILLTARQLLPETHIQVITNGLQLEKCPLLPYLLTAPNTSLSLSIHSSEPDYIAKIHDSMTVINGWIARFGIRAIMSDNRTGWVRHHIGVGRFMKPYTDGDVEASWRSCPARVCVVLLEGRLWKCPQIASLHLAAEHFSLQASEAWAPYLAYRGVDVGCSDAELEAFFARGAESICGMCPAKGVPYQKDIHNVEFDMPDVVRVERGGVVVRETHAAEVIAA